LNAAGARMHGNSLGEVVKKVAERSEHYV
jgi:hypothetical protein